MDSKNPTIHFITDKINQPLFTADHSALGTLWFRDLPSMSVFGVAHLYRLKSVLLSIY